MNNEFGSLLRGTRERAGRSMGQLARHLGVSVPFLSDVERGHRSPLVGDRIKAAAAFLGVGAEPLLQAAARCKGAFMLDAGVGPAGQRFGAVLMRQWTDFTEADFEALQAELDRLAARKGSDADGTEWVEG